MLLTTCSPRLEQAFEAEKQFTLRCFHELRTPPPSSLPNAATQEARDDLEEYREAIDVIDRQAQKMSLLTQSLLDMTRLDLGTRQLAKEDLDLSAMLRAICEEQDTGARQISLHPSIEEGIHIMADPFQISRVIINLLKMPGNTDGKTAASRYAFQKQDAQAVLQVEDDGIGIPAEHLDKSGSASTRSIPPVSPAEDWGLGLSMVRQIVLLHGGTIDAVSRPGEGTCFTAKFPVGR